AFLERGLFQTFLSLAYDFFRILRFPLERQQSHLARKKETHKEMRVYVTSEIKDEFRLMCETKGVTQSEMIEKLIKEAVNQHGCLVKD
ncbi:RepB family protein, partial [Klebsiella quasipneumoniae]|uniref:RepB family protein n=1 Tax=Klebsiella quasipneumoniae TaxID=1463165 RepID=UPI00292BF833